MWKRKRNNSNNDGWEEAALVALFIITVFILLWVLFWIWVILSIVWIIYLTHVLNEEFELYNTEYYSWAILTFLISILIILFFGTQIAYNMWKINNTFWWWATESSNYWKIKNSKWKTSIEPNIEWVIQKWVVDSITSTWSNFK